MSAMSVARGQLKTALQGIGLTVLDSPVNVTGNCVIMASQDPALVNVNTMGTADEFEYNLLLQVVGGNANTLVQLEDTLEDIILALGTTDWFPGDASAPYMGDGGDSKVFLTIALPVRQIIEITGGS